MKKFLMIAFLATASLMLYSCSDDSPAAPDAGTYFPTTIGSWWISDAYDIDANNNKTGSIIQTDSVAITQELTIDGKTAHVFSYYDEDGDVYTQQVYAAEGSKIYVYSDIIDRMIDSLEAELKMELPFRIGDRWLLWADFNQATWTTFEKPIENFQLDSLGVATLDGNLYVTGAKGDTKNMTVDGVSYEAQEFIFVYKFVGTVKTGLGNSDITFEIRTINWLGKDAGVLATIWPESTIDFLVDQYVVGGYGSWTSKLHIAE
ncbi:MAG: hypothetical protein ACLFQX_11225 [Candidatus Kapaibacterium sp.]